MANQFYSEYFSYNLIINSNSTVYYWRSYAIDPVGTNTWSGTQTPYSFTVEAIATDTFNFRGLNFSGINIEWIIVWTNSKT